jgi:hypothetical protein
VTAACVEIELLGLERREDFGGGFEEQCGRAEARWLG